MYIFTLIKKNSHCFSIEFKKIYECSKNNTAQQNCLIQRIENLISSENLHFFLKHFIFNLARRQVVKK